MDKITSHRHMQTRGRYVEARGSRESCKQCSAQDRQTEFDRHVLSETHVQVCYRCQTVWESSPCGNCGGAWSVMLKKSPELARQHYAELARQATKFTDGEPVEVDNNGIIVLKDEWKTF